MRFLINSFIFLSVFNVFAQEVPDFTAIDSLYREDQFYLGITYNVLQNTPTGLSEGKFTPSFSLGFLRDMPINKNRTVAIAAGIGYAINNFNQNILISETDGNPHYDFIASGVNFDKNKLTLHYVEMPVEFRWRTSTPESHIFWRVYTGLKMSYLVYDRSKYSDGQDKIIVTNNKDLNKLQYGAYVAAGRNTWNFYAYYGLNPIFKSAELNGKRMDMTTFNMGLMFYIL
jgi:hypothetical protein